MEVNGQRKCTWGVVHKCSYHYPHWHTWWSLLVITKEYIHCWKVTSIQWHTPLWQPLFPLSFIGSLSFGWFPQQLWKWMILSLEIYGVGLYFFIILVLENKIPSHGIILGLLSICLLTPFFFHLVSYICRIPRVIMSLSSSPLEIRDIFIEWLIKNCIKWE
jgi:hypothetical protein